MDILLLQVIIITPINGFKILTNIPQIEFADTFMNDYKSSKIEELMIISMGLYVGIILLMCSVIIFLENKNILVLGPRIRIKILDSILKISFVINILNCLFYISVEFVFLLTKPMPYIYIQFIAEKEINVLIKHSIVFTFFIFTTVITLLKTMGFIM